MSTVYEPVIGIEVHAQLKVNTKLFCGCSIQFGDHPNTNVCPTCLGLPGALPVLNKRAVELAIRAGKALNCTIQHTSVFSRKNYFYADLPKGYQISQFDLPICTEGYVDIEVDGQTKRIGIERIHMEEDAGKLLHQGAEAIAGADYSLSDLNRACTPLIEIVSQPDVRSAAEARAYVEKIRTLLRHADVCDGNLEEGSMRADVNISIRPQGQEKFGTRTEVKNVNSFRSIERATVGEIKRQTEVLNSGGEIIQQTRNYDDATQKTTPLRSKEEAHDYRYFPEPDLKPLVLTDDFINSVVSEMPESFETKQTRFAETYDLGDYETGLLLDDIGMGKFLDAVVVSKNGKVSPKEICKWVLGDVSAVMKEKKQRFDSIALAPEELAAMVEAIGKGDISGKMAKDMLPKLFESGAKFADVVKASGGAQISDSSELDSIIQKVWDENPDVVEKIRAGKTQSVNFLMGQVMKESKGRAKPDLVRELLLKKQ